VKKIGIIDGSYIRHLPDNYPIMKSIIGLSDRGPKNEPVMIRDVEQFKLLFGNMNYPMYEKQSIGRGFRKSVERVFSDLDPYGEENWEG
jgi:hypothetical protein